MPGYRSEGRETADGLGRQNCGSTAQVEYSDTPAEDILEYPVAFPCPDAGSYMGCAGAVVEYCPERMLLPGGFVSTSTAQRPGVGSTSGGEDASTRPDLKDSFLRGR